MLIMKIQIIDEQCRPKHKHFLEHFMSFTQSVFCIVANEYLMFCGGHKYNINVHIVTSFHCYKRPLRIKSITMETTFL